MEELADHGITLPPNMQGLTDEQIEELKLKDEWAERCQPSGGHIEKKDEIGRRNGIGKNKFLAFYYLQDAMLVRYLLSSCVRLSVHLSVHQSVISQSSSKTAKPRITKTVSYDSQGI